jgi:uncharacterized Zn finger protein
MPGRRLLDREGLVSGGSLYEVEVTIDSNGDIARYDCGCAAFDAYGGLCKHCVAALLLRA